ncbi:MAG: porin [Anaplasma ovis]
MVHKGSLVAPVMAAALLLASSGGVAASTEPQEESKGYAFVTGRVLSYAWLLDDNPVGDEHEGHRRVRNDDREVKSWRYGRHGISDAHVFEHNLGSWGTSYDAALAVGLRSKGSTPGLVYGADFALSVPVGSFGKSFYDEMVGAGSRIFADTPYGTFLLGYQEGVESSMKADVLALVPGGGGGAWGKYLRCFLGYASGMPFHMYPGLYSENLFRSIGSFDRVGVLRETRRFLGVLPMRLSYMSPRLGGFSLGVSYSPSGYRDDLFKSDAYRLGVGRNVGSEEESSGSDSETVQDAKLALVAVKPSFDLGPVYKNILSGALRYDWGDDDVAIGLSVTGEYARPKRYADILNPGTSPFVEYSNLAALSAGAEMKFAGLKAAVSYGYLGGSGRPKVVSQSGRTWEVPYGTNLPSYYFASSLGYGYGDFYSSVVYFVSRVGHTVGVARGGAAYHDYGKGFDGEHVLRDLAVGLGYNLYERRGTKFGLFVSCHAFSLEQRPSEFKRGDNADYVRTSDSTQGRENHKHDGVVVLSGVKFDF